MKLYDEIKKYLEDNCTIGSYFCEIAKHLDSAKATVAEGVISLHSSNGSVYPLDYEPAINPIKNMYKEYIGAFNCYKDFLCFFIETIMSDLKKIIFEQNKTITEIMGSAKSVSRNCEKIESYASKILSSMNEILEIVVRGVVEKGQSTKTPAEIYRFVVTNAKTLDLYNSSTGIRSKFNELSKCLEELNASLMRLDISAFKQMQSVSDFNTMLASLDKVCSNLDLSVDAKKSEKNEISDMLKRADGLMTELQSKIAMEMQKRIAPISMAFDRIVRTVPERSDDVVSIEPQGDRTVSTLGLQFSDMLKEIGHKKIATLTFSSACAVQKDERDCKGQFNIDVLKEMHIISSDAEVLFIVDDGYSETKLLEYQRIDINDFKKGDKIYFSRSAYNKLMSIMRSKG